MKETFIIRTEWASSILELSIEEQAILFQNLLHYHMGAENLINLNNLSVRLVWKLIQPSLDRNILEYDRRKETSRLNGMKGGRPAKNQEDTENGKPNGNLNNLTEPNETLSVLVPVPVLDGNTPPNPQGGSIAGQEPELKNYFDAFRIAYRKAGGQGVRGLETEWGDFKKRHKKIWQQVCPILLPALEAQLRIREQKELRKEFVPQLANFSTYINQKRWESVEGFEEKTNQIQIPAKPPQVEYRPVNATRDEQEQYEAYIHKGLANLTREEINWTYWFQQKGGSIGKKQIPNDQLLIREFYNWTRAMEQEKEEREKREFNERYGIAQ